MKGIENAAVLGLLPVPPALGSGGLSHHLGMGDEPSLTAADVLQWSFASIKEGIPYVLRQARDLMVMRTVVCEEVEADVG